MLRDLTPYQQGGIAHEAQHFGLDERSLGACIVPGTHGSVLAARERDLHSTLEQDCTAESAETETPQEVRERKHGLLFGWFCFSMLPLAVWLLCGGPK